MVSPDEGFSGLSDFFGFRSVGKILMTVNVIADASPTTAVMYPASMSIPRALSKAVVE